MGFFSFKCKGCGESIKAPCDLPRRWAWQNRIVVVVSDIERYAGAYDGYGRVCMAPSVGSPVDSWTYCLYGYPAHAGGCPEGIWHERCAPEKGGHGPSERDGGDQGYFYERPFNATAEDDLLEGLAEVMGWNDEQE